MMKKRLKKLQQFHQVDFLIPIEFKPSCSVYYVVTNFVCECVGVWVWMGGGWYICFSYILPDKTIASCHVHRGPKIRSLVAGP